MADKSKFAELDKAIKGKRAELDKVRKEKAEAGENPEKLVLAEKHERQLAAQISALEQARAAAEYRPPEPTDRAELLKCLQRYRDEKAAKVQKVAQDIQDAEQEITAVGWGLQRAAKLCDTEKAVELSEKRDDLQSRLKHLKEMQERVNALQVFPDDAIPREWSDICKKAMPDWKSAVLQVETLASAYKAACAALLQMHDTLLAVRTEFEKAAAADGQELSLQHGVFTAGWDGDRLAVSKSDYIRLNGLGKPLTGRAL